MKEGKIPCTVAILTRNSGATLERALGSVKEFAEIIVCDGGSSDDTLALAECYGASVIRQSDAYRDPSGRIKDFSGVRNQTLDAARQPWFLFLDADEYASPQLADAIRTAVQRNPAAYWVYRKYELHGICIECASTYPNRNMRFFHRSLARAFIKSVHERIELNPGAAVSELPSDAPIMVPIDESPAEWRRKNRRYIELGMASEASVSWASWFASSLRMLAISARYALRTLRCLLSAQPGMPLAYEWNRHWYHAVIICKEFRRLIRS